MISFQDASFSYGSDTAALRHATVTIPAGQFVCLVGANGSGKSTFSKLINALLRPTDGAVLVDGKDTTEANEVFAIRSAATMVFQNPDDQIVASIVEDDTAFGPENLGLEADEIRRRVDASLAAVGMETLSLHEVATLSGGQKQRVAIAGALAMHPKAMVLDEASAMLDPQGRAELMRVCKKLNADGMTIVMITHLMEEAAQADRVIALSHGQVVLDGAPQDMLTNEVLLDELCLATPFSVRMSRLLQERGVSVGTHITPDRLEEELCLLHSKA